MPLIPDIIHPDYRSKFMDWEKWELAYEGGRNFIDAYLVKLSSREDQGDFDNRRNVTYCPAFAKTGVNEVKDSIYQRMADIIRAGGSSTYQEAISGLNNGMDLLGSSMNYFMGCKVLPELLTMAKVGIFVDMPPVNGPSIADNVGIRPYIYMYKCKDIRTWIVDDNGNPNEFQAIILKDYVDTYDEKTGFPLDNVCRYRHVWKDKDGKIWMNFYYENGNEISEPIELRIPRIPFVVASLSESLMTDIADYQISLLNIASTDVSYLIKANFPFYTEQFNPKVQATHLKQDNEEKVPEAKVGSNKGRRYPVGVERPGFINPSSDPLKTSMAKQEQMKEEIRLLLKLTISNLQGPKMASAESKKQDTQSLETGLSYIGLTLENTERKIAEYWSMYEGNNNIATVNYPETYSLRTEEDRYNESEKLEKLLSQIPSLEFQKSIAKRIAKVTLGTKVSKEVFEIIEKEIDSAKVIVTDPDVVQKDVEAGLVSLQLASEIRGYPDGEVDKAKADHAERIARISLAQSTMIGTNGAARGNPNIDPDPLNSAKIEKTQSRDTTQDPVVTSKIRGTEK